MLKAELEKELRRKSELLKTAETSVEVLREKNNELLDEVGTHKGMAFEFSKEMREWKGRAEGHQHTLDNLFGKLTK